MRISRHRDNSKISSLRRVVTFYIDYFICLLQSKKPTESFTLKTVSNDSILGSFFEAEGSDKGSNSGQSRHNYHLIYEILFQKSRDSIQNVLEVGIGTTDPTIPSSMGKVGIPGASLRAFSRYFHNATIYGLDIDPTTMISEDRINTFVCDQTSMESLNSIQAKFIQQGIAFDLIIDDGLHTFDAFKKTYQSLHQLLNKNAFYIVEDVIGWKTMKYLKEINENDFDILIFSGDSVNRRRKIIDNNLLVLRRKS